MEQTKQPVSLPLNIVWNSVIEINLLCLYLPPYIHCTDIRSNKIWA